MRPTINDYTIYYLHSLPELDQASYIASFPDFFCHYFDFWSFDHITFSFGKEHVEKGRRIVLEGLEFATQILNKYGYDVSNIEVVLFVGNGTANGHAFLNNGKAYVWLPVEDYPDVFTAKVFILHEFFHAFHYLINKDFRFDDQKEFKDLLRQLVIEGIATKGSQNLLGLSEEDALWGNYLNQEEKRQWIKKCRSQFSELWKYTLQLLETQEDDMNLFYPFDPNTIYRFRGGYYAGLQLINQVMEKEDVTLDQLMKKGYEDWQKLVKGVLN